MRAARGIDRGSSRKFWTCWWFLHTGPRQDTRTCHRQNQYLSLRIRTTTYSPCVSNNAYGTQRAVGIRWALNSVRNQDMNQLHHALRFRASDEPVRSAIRRALLASAFAVLPLFGSA